MIDLAGRLAAARARWPALDHLIRAYGRYDADGGNRLAGAVSYYGFLSVFPLVALGFSVLGFVLAGNAAAREQFVAVLEASFPGLVGGRGGIEVTRLIQAKTSAGIVGLVGLLWIGSSWIDVLRESLRSIWHQNIQAGNIAVKKLRDVLVLAGLGATVAVSLAGTALVTAATSHLLEWLDVQDTRGATVVARIIGVVVALVTDTLLFAYLYTGLPRLRTPLRRVFRGALLAAVLFEILKLVGTFYIKRTTHNPVYGAVAVAVGLLVWINLVSRILLFCAAWTVTAGGRSDLEPSGTASREAAREAGLPEHFAAPGAEPPPALTVDGAPAPLSAAVQGEARGSGYAVHRPPAKGQPRQPAARDGVVLGAVGAVLGLWLRRRRH